MLGLSRKRNANQSNPRTALIFGVLFLATFVFSIAGVLLYNPVLHPAVPWPAPEAKRARLGAVLEMLLIIANIGTAVVVYPIFKRQFEVLSIGYVTARLAECTFIAIGMVATSWRITAGRPPAAGSLLNDAKAQLVASATGRSSSARAFVGAGVGNGLILGYMMYRSGLVHEASRYGAHRSLSSALPGSGWCST